MKMATSKQLGEEVTCSICLEYFTDPVAAECGHAFCLSCITRCWEGLETDFPCPQCRDTSKNKILRPIRQLGNVVELLRQLQTPSAATEGEDLCREHEEKLKLFCEDDQVPICVVYRESKVHKAHSVFPMHEAAQVHKKTLHGHVKRLKRELESLQKWAAEESRTASKVEGNFNNQVKALHSTFDLLKKFLDKDEQQLFCKLESEHKDNMKKIQEKLSELEKQQSTHQDLITEIEGKCQQQDVDLLKDVQIILRRCNNAKAQKTPDDVVVEQTLKSIGQHASLQDKLLELRETFPAKLEWAYIKSWATAVTLDPDTAHRSLILSEDGRSVRHRHREQDLPNTPQRFTGFTDVLGTQRMTSGRHYWEVAVELGYKMSMTLGVCDEAVSRMGELIPSPENGYWAVWLRDGKYEANTSPPTLLTPRVPPRAVGLFLDYEAGRLSLYNVDDRSLLFTFSGASFPPTLRPFFSPEFNWEGKNAGALRILPVTQE
ncbi:E3 ubiquitin-protein ligase TRIM39-like [Pleurodeles waltl]|uniref:E3 ubiquitin-protein ligase TRIM39-like n=1 Tax=Pleurodeles waltl TaxID=8319 RepID=UPI003709637A